MEKMEIEKEPNETNEEPKKPNEPKEENVQMEKKENNNEKERHLERNEKYEVDVLIFLRNKIFSRIKNKIKKEYEFKHIGNFLFTKTLTNEVKKDYLLSFNIQENNAFLYDLKAVFFIRKNKYTDEMKSGKQSCLKINVKNMNKGDLIDIKAKLAKLNVISVYFNNSFLKIVQNRVKYPKVLISLDCHLKLSKSFSLFFPSC